MSRDTRAYKFNRIVIKNCILLVEVPGSMANVSTVGVGYELQVQRYKAGTPSTQRYPFANW